MAKELRDAMEAYQHKGLTEVLNKIELRDIHIDVKFIKEARILQEKLRT